MVAELAAMQREQAAVCRRQQKELKDQTEQNLQRMKDLAVVIRSCPPPPPPPQVLPDTSGVAGPQPVTAPFPTPRVGVACARQGPAPIPALRRRDKEQLLSPPLAHPPAQPELEVSVGGTCYTIAGGGGGM